MWRLSSSQRIPQYIRGTLQYFTVRPLETLLPLSSGRKKTSFWRQTRAGKSQTLSKVCLSWVQTEAGSFEYVRFDSFEHFLSHWIFLITHSWLLWIFLITQFRFQKMPNGSLVIHDVSTEDTGSYTCIAGNSCNIAHTSAELYVVGESDTLHILQ